MVWFIGTQADCLDERSLADKTHGPYPKRGNFTAAGAASVVPTVPATWDGLTERPVGWTAHHVEVVRRTDTDQFAVFIEPFDAAKETANLTAEERTRRANRRAAATASLPAGWESSVKRRFTAQFHERIW